MTHEVWAKEWIFDKMCTYISNLGIIITIIIIIFIMYIIIVPNNFLIWTFLYPLTLGGWFFRLTLLYVCLSICGFFSSGVFLSNHSYDFFDFFCIKLAFSKSKKVTKPDFRKKIIWPKFRQIGPKFAQIWGFWSIIQVWIIKFLWFCIFQQADMMSKW